MSFVKKSSALADAISDAQPCGVSVEYDADFLQLEQEVLGRPEVEYGSSVTQAVEPNWQSVMSLSLSLMGKSRDLRVAVHLTRAQLNVYGFAGIADGLELIQGLLDRQWRDVHPQLDPDDNNDPLQRINILLSLCDPVGMLRELRDAPLVSVRSLGKFSIRDIEIASGEMLAVSGPEKPTSAIIEAAFNEADQGELIGTEKCLSNALACTIRIEQLLTEKVGVARSIDLSPLSTLLHRAAESVRRHLVVNPGEGQVMQVAAGAGMYSPLQLGIANRDDVKNTLDRLCSYYMTHEPSSPVPLLLARARELVDKKFMELVQDLASDGLAQLKLISGTNSES
ncbi:type VI secretion system protein TssA [Pseudomonas caspiana]|nr:type VI secretion system protein TssA [Pseudomonas caspiana]